MPDTMPIPAQDHPYEAREQRKRLHEWHDKAHIMHLAHMKTAS